MNKPPAFQFYAKDWIADTARLTLELEGAYIRLLCHQWNEGPLPDDPSELAEVLGVTKKRFRRLWGKLSRYFPAGESGTLANPRLESERAKQLAYREKRAQAGRASAEQRGNICSTGVEQKGQHKSNSAFASASAEESQLLNRRPLAAVRGAGA